MSNEIENKKVNPYWIELKKVYYNYLITTNQTKLLSLVTEEIFKEFPKNLPPGTKSSIISNLSRFKALRDIFIKDIYRGLTNIIEDFYSKIENNEKISGKMKSKLASMLEELKKLNSEFNMPKEFDLEIDDIFMAVLNIVISSSLGLEIDIGDIDFQRLVLGKELVMLFASLDAYFSDVLNTICHAKPEIMKPRVKEKLKLETILDLGSWEKLIDYLCDDYSKSFEKKPIGDRIKSMKKKLDIDIKCPENELEQLREAELIRHLFVHNGGKIDYKFLEETGRTDLQIGDLAPISRDYLDRIEDIALMLVDDIFVKVSEKFFGIDASELIPQRLLVFRNEEKNQKS